jgi:hypothetical protein
MAGLQIPLDASPGSRYASGMTTVIALAFDPRRRR